MTLALKDIKNIQELKGAQAVRGEFYLVANRGTSRQFVLGYTQEGTFSVEREYRNSDQNQTVSGVKGLVHLDSATVTFETQSLQLSKDLYSKVKGLNSTDFTDVDGSKYDILTESSYVDWDRYIDKLELMFEFVDGRKGGIVMNNVIDKSTESLAFSRTDDVLVSVMFEATIDENDSDEILPYAIWVEKDSIEKILEKAKSKVESTPYCVNDPVGEEDVFSVQIEKQIIAELQKYDEYKTIVPKVDKEDVLAFFGSPKGTFINNIKVKLGAVEGGENFFVDGVIAATASEEIKTDGKKVIKDNK